MENRLIRKNEIVYFDILKILATFCVILIHITNRSWDSNAPKTLEWFVCSIGNGIARWCVPIFVMISGACFLDKEITPKKLHSKYILKIFTTLVFWSTAYAILDVAKGYPIKDIWVQIICGHYHLWFLYMLIGLYIIIPFVSLIARSKSLSRYFLIIAFVFTFFIPTILAIIASISSGLSNTIIAVMNKIDFHFTLGYVAYYIIGYYLCKNDISKKIRIIIYILSGIGFIGAIGISFFSSVFHTPLYDEYFSLFVLFESIGVFVLFKYTLGKKNFSEKTKNVLGKLSKYGFGAYLVHDFIIELVEGMGLNIGTFNPILSVALITLTVFVISYLISFILNHIPFINKHLV